MEKIKDPLEQWRLLCAYVACMKNVVGVWRSFFHTFQPERFPDKQLQGFLDRINLTMSALKNKYLYDPLSALNITPNASGFPLRHDIRILETDSANLKKTRCKKSINPQGLRNALIDNIFSQKAVNMAFLEKLGKKMSEELIFNSQPLSLFHISNIMQIEAENGKRTFMCLWERYGHSNIPCLYAMLFEYSSDDELSQDFVKELSFILREETSQMPLLSQLGRHIDYAMANVHPKWIGRIILGPVFISHLTKDDNLLQRTLDDLFEGGSLGAASRIIYEYVVSEKETKAKALFDPRGRKHEVIQEFAVRSLDDECMNRGVTHVEKFLFAPHSVIQMLDEDYRKEIGHQLIGGE